jgi:hypothetical protein
MQKYLTIIIVVVKKIIVYFLSSKILKILIPLFFESF